MECSKPKKIIIAIDGFSSCGKSTFAKTIAAKLGYIFIDTGAMYRAVTLYALEHGAIVSGIVDEEKVIALLDDISIDFRFQPRTGRERHLRQWRPGGGTHPHDRSEQLREPRQLDPPGTRKTRGYAAGDGSPAGRGHGRTRHRHGGIPQCRNENLMTADPEVRARRRYDELLAKGDSVSLEEIRANIVARDKADMTRAISPLRQADDAVVLDNSHMTVEEQMTWFMERFDRIACGR